MTIRTALVLLGGLVALGEAAAPACFIHSKIQTIKKKAYGFKSFCELQDAYLLPLRRPEPLSGHPPRSLKNRISYAQGLAGCLSIASGDMSQRFCAEPWRWVFAIPSVLGFALALRCVWDFGWTGHGTPAPIALPKRLVIVGCYRHVLNPMYVGFVGGWIGLWVVFGHFNLPVAITIAGGAGQAMRGARAPGGAVRRRRRDAGDRRHHGGRPLTPARRAGMAGGSSTWRCGA